MTSTVPVLLFLGLGALVGVHAQQVTSASIALIPELATLPFSGEIAGTGADGTTYVLSASGTDSGDIPFTMTVVQDATRVSEVISLATGLGANAQCTYDSQGLGACTIVFEGAGAGTDTDAPPQTAVFSSTTIPLIAVPVTTAPGTSSSAESANGSATSSPPAEASDNSSGAVRSITAVSMLSAFLILLAGLVNV